MSHDGDDIIYAACFFGYGIFGFFKGFNRLNEKRLIENTPLSTVRGFAMGLVKLNGKAKKTKIIQSPLSGDKCVFYQYTVEQRGDRSGWQVIAKGDSSFCPFVLDDGTGTIMVYPQQVELMMSVDYHFETGLFGCGGLPDNLIDFMNRNKLKYGGLFGSCSLRFKEWFVKPDETIFVLGTAEKNNDFEKDHHEKLIQRLEELKGNPQKMLEVDSNKDGIISDDEWDNAVAKVEQDLLNEELASNTQSNVTDVVIGKGDSKQAFVISKEDEIRITVDLSWQVFLKVFGGAALSLAMLAYLLFRLSPWIRF